MLKTALFITFQFIHLKCESLSLCVCINAEIYLIVEFIIANYI